MIMDPQIASVLSGERQWVLLGGDAFDLLRQIPAQSVDLILTSPPYWGLREYEQEHNWEILAQWCAEQGTKTNEEALIPSYEWYRSHGGVLGLEPLPEWYLANLVAMFDLAKVALKPTGSLWLNLGDTYFARWSSIRSKGRQGLNGADRQRRKTPMGGYRQEKQLLMIPARVAIALQDRRWILRNDLIWYKPNVPPRPFEDRLGSTHEHFFHFVHRPKEGRAKYHYDLTEAGNPAHDVQKVLVAPGRDGHSATFPTKLIEPRIRSCCPPNGVVLDLFAGTGTTLAVAVRNGRRGIGFDVNRRFIESASERLNDDQQMMLPTYNGSL